MRHAKLAASFTNYEFDDCDLVNGEPAVGIDKTPIKHDSLNKKKRCNKCAIKHDPHTVLLVQSISISKKYKKNKRILAVTTANVYLFVIAVIFLEI